MTIASDGDGAELDAAGLSRVLHVRGRAAVTLLEADPFDRAAFEELMLRQDARAELRQEAGRRALLDVLTAMTPEARRACTGS